jgi:hypothetical protein
MSKRLLNDSLKIFGKILKETPVPNLSMILAP